MQYAIHAHALTTDDSGLVRQSHDLVPDWVQTRDAEVSHDTVTTYLAEQGYSHAEDNSGFTGWGEVWTNADGEHIAIAGAGVPPEPDADYYELADSDTANLLTATDLGITDDEYADIIRDSLTCGQWEGHVRPDILDGRRVYAREA